MHRLVVLLALPLLHAQDTRHVSEPKFPPACEVLTAHHAAPGGVLSDAAEHAPDTARIQRAIDTCGAGKAVELKPSGANNIFLTGPIQLKPGVTLLIDADTALFASRDPRDYDVQPGSCGIVGARGPGCKSLIVADNAPGSGIMGDGSIDGRGGAKLLGVGKSWWDLAKEAKVLDRMQAVTRLLVVRQSDNFTLYRITMRNSPNFHVSVNNTNGFTAWGVKIKTPKTGRNTDGIDPSSSTNVTIKDCDIDNGDDNVAIKSGASGPSSHITIEDNHFYNGHGMSIGSNTDGGVSHVVVRNLTIDGADNGIRIKSDRSRGGLVEDVSYENVCMRNVTKPVILTSMYTTNPGTKIPVYRNIRLTKVRALTPGWMTILGVDGEHKIEAAFRDVLLDGLSEEHTVMKNADMVDEQSGMNLDCSGRFTPYPAIPTAPEAAVTVLPEDPTMYVAASGSGDFWSIQRSIDMAPPEGAVISVAPGTYREVLTITKPNITIRSAYSDASKTVIVFNKSAGD